MLKNVLTKIDIYHMVLKYLRKGNTDESSSKVKTPPHHATNKGFHPDFPESGMRVKREDLIPRFPNLSTHGSSDPSFRKLSARSHSDPVFTFNSATEDLLFMPANEALELRGSSRQPRFNNERYSDTDIPIYTNRYNLPKPEMRGRRLNSVPKNLLSGLPEFRPPVRTLSQISLLDYNTDAQRTGQSTSHRSKEIPRNQGSSTNLLKQRGCSSKIPILVKQDSYTRSKIPILVKQETYTRSKIPTLVKQESYTRSMIPVLLTRDRRTRSKIPVLVTRARRINSYGMSTPQGNANLIDDIQSRRLDRTETSVKFERIFKSLCKRKHNSGNVIDSTTHTHWMRLAGITADKDASMFKIFAGGKVVLTFGEYKCFINKICTAHDLDYWEVMRKMTTFQEEELHPENGI